MHTFREIWKSLFHAFHKTLLDRGKSKSFRAKKKLENEYGWSLGVEDPFYFSSQFEIENNSVTIAGTQITHDHSWPIRYSITKTSKLGTSIKYIDSIVLNGDHTNGGFQYTFKGIPSGTGYRLEVFNHFRYHAKGRIRIITKDQGDGSSGT